MLILFFYFQPDDVDGFEYSKSNKQIGQFKENKKASQPAAKSFPQMSEYFSVALDFSEAQYSGTMSLATETSAVATPDLPLVDHSDATEIKESLDDLSTLDVQPTLELTDNAASTTILEASRHSSTNSLTSHDVGPEDIKTESNVLLELVPSEQTILDKDQDSHSKTINHLNFGKLSDNVDDDELWKDSSPPPLPHSAPPPCPPPRRESFDSVLRYLGEDELATNRKSEGINYRLPSDVKIKARVDILKKRSLFFGFSLPEDMEENDDDESVSQKEPNIAHDLEPNIALDGLNIAEGNSNLPKGKPNSYNARVLDAM